MSAMSDINPQIDTSSMSTSQYDRPASQYDTQKAADNATANGAALKDTILNNAQSAMNTVQNHPITQNVVNGPVATSVKNEAGAANDEFNDLANSRKTPSYTAANDTPLTHYHSFFYTLLSWKNPRATGITFIGAIVFIFACRYLPLLSWGLRMTWTTLGIVALAETIGKFVMGTSVTSSVRPRRYYKIPKESLEASLDDLEQLINFFVIEVQRIVFAENIPVTITAFIAAFLTYYLIRIVPMWGMSLIATCVIYLGPLIYIQNKEFIDEHVTHASHVIATQANQVKDLTAQHTGQGIETLKAYTGEYTAKAQEALGVSTRNRQQIPAQNTSSRVQEGDFNRQQIPTQNTSSRVQEGDFNRQQIPTQNTSSRVQEGDFNRQQNSFQNSGSRVQEGDFNRQQNPFQNSSSRFQEGDFPSAPRSDLPSAAEHSKPIVYTPGNDEFAASTA